MIELKNKRLSVTVAEKGAELQSIKDADGREYLWQAGPEWARRSPILFPLVCSVNGGTYRVDGQEYHLPRHGFARDREFQIIRRTKDLVTLGLHSDRETLAVYPYRFALLITYQLRSNRLIVFWQVDNVDNREIHFQIGGHPAFNILGGRLDGTIRLDNTAPMTALKSYPDGSHDMEEVPLEAEEGILHIDNSFFRNDSVKIHNSQTHEAILLDTDGRPAVTVSYSAPVCAFWSPYGKEAPFVCIEPWYGIGDPRGYDGEFKDKPLMNHLLPGAAFIAHYTVTIG